jgi:hypothetical protein
VARRRRVDIFLILYLAAIVGFAVVSRERDRIEGEKENRYEDLVRAFIPKLPLHPETDTVRHYVSADDESGLVGDSHLFSTRIFIRDIDPDDAVSMQVHSIIYDSVLITPDLLQVGQRSGVGNVSAGIVYFPLTGAFPRTGAYTINLVAHSRRMQPTADGRINYRGRQFDSTDIPDGLVSSLEIGKTALTVLVIDTSIAQPSNVEALRLQFERSSISSAAGFQEENVISVAPRQASPTMSIVHGGGMIVQEGDGSRVTQYRWKGTVPNYSDTIVVEARLDRGAGGKDITRSSFVVHGELPYLVERIPERLFAGEEVVVDLRVNGLDQTGLYSWALYEDMGADDFLLKSSGEGPVATYRIPTSYSGKRLVVEARYRGRPYNFLSARNHRSGVSRIGLPVETPPTRIMLSLPERAPANAAFRFRASRYSHPRFMGEQPLDRISDVAVEIRTADNRLLETSVSMIRKGEFEFELTNTASIIPGGEQVMITIRAGDALHHHSMRYIR